ncbi:hypothetical protein FZ934_20145 (plasmid) [Rhizobium grahamii]|uniref:TniQ domain-containing protein n=1 Tax=Rhizobium grahamii TaxID=1120045 RepID=A0A5Q0CB82_9HYPH|nr:MULTISPECIES: TniQ family protein [Rhizobium]QFY62693.1 hypothetical protein FZ934_20145 [Rhizobium grahamii]QRM52563.1 hypothetical protein F3Y33_25515 [Rhizobium sp. BG6]
MALPVPVTIHGYETTESLVSRLSAANGFRSAKGLLNAIGIRPRRLAAGLPRDLALLSQWSGTEVAALARFLHVNSPDHQTWRLGDAVFGRLARAAIRFRYCPACILDDLENGIGRPLARPYVRPGWTCRALIHCPQHRHPLVEAPSWDSNDFCRFVDANLSLIRSKVQPLPSLEPIEVDTYIEARIKGARTCSYLDRFEVYVVLDLCEHLGRFVHAHRRAVTHVPAELWTAPAREIGFHIASQGEQHLRDTFAEIIRFKRAGTRSRLGFLSLGDWLRQNSTREDFAEILKLFQDVAERNLPFAPGEICFVPVRRRYRHTVHSAAAEYGIARDRVIKLLNESGVLKRRLTGRSCFDISDAHRVLSSDLSAAVVSRINAGKQLGASPKLMRQILQANLLPRVRTSDGSKITVAIAERDLSEFKHRIFQNVTIAEEDNTMLTIATMRLVTGVDPFDALVALHQGELEKTKAGSDHGYNLGSLRFDPQEVVNHWNVKQKATHLGIDGNGLIPSRAAKFLRVTPKTIPLLLQHNLVELEPTDAENDSKDRLITLASMATFKEKWVSQVEAAEILGVRPPLVLFLLEEMRGVKRIFNSTAGTSAIFLKSDVTR